MASRSSDVSRAIWIAAVAIGTLAAPSAGAQYDVRCSSGSEAELRHDIREHALNTALLDEKFQHIYYPARHDVPGADVDLGAIRRYLESLAPRRAAVLFQAHRRGALCTWLVTTTGITSHVANVGDGALASLRPRLMRSLGVREAILGRSPIPRGLSVAEGTSSGEREPTGKVLGEAAKLLVPAPIERQLIGQQIETLVLVPSADVGTFPFAALPVEGRRLVDVASIVVAPGFEAFVHPPAPPARPFRRAVIVGNPAYPRDGDFSLPDLPGAEAEARDVAGLVSAEAIVGKSATIRRVRALVSAPGRAPDLVYLATHGLSDAANPLDGSTLWLADGRWSARAISTLPLSRSHPLVVLSACQTGLGKTFDVGTIGMSRAWTRAGAAAVVMSLWRVDDDATKVLMTRFLALAASSPVDVALRKAMLETRETYRDEVRWASFAVLGLPERTPSFGR